MSMLQISLASVIGVLLAIQVKGMKIEYGLYTCLGISLLLCFCVVERLCSLQEIAEQVKQCAAIDKESMKIILKMVGITYLSEFASSICKDAGYQTIALQIEMISKLTILVMGLPVLCALLEILQQL